MRKIIALLILFFRKARRVTLRFFMKSLFCQCGKHVRFSPDDHFSYSKIQIGSDVYIGPGAHFNTITSIKIGNKVLFGPGVTIMGGNHNTGVVGKMMYDISYKRPEDDLPVVIEDDVWIGTDVTILKGVTIHSGSIVAAGAVVTKDVPHDAIVAGIPARIIKYRFDGEQLEKHREMLGRATAKPTP